MFCQLALMPVTDRIAAVSEMHRVLAAEGRVAINVPGMMQPPFAIIGEALARHVKPALSRFVDAVFSMHDPAEMEHLLDDGGFTDVAVEVVSHSFRLGPPEEFLWSYINSTPLGVAVAEADPAKRDQVQDDVITAWQPFTEDGALILEQPIVVATGTTR